MIKSLLIIALIGSFVLTANSDTLFAQQDKEIIEYSYGTVKKVSLDRIIVIEYDYTQEKEIDVTYFINADTELYNIDSLSNLKAGDNVEIDYIIKDSKMIATAITVEKTSDEEGLVY